MDVGLNRIAAAALSINRNESPQETLLAVTQSKPHDVSLPLWNDVIKACTPVRREFTAKRASCRPATAPDVSERLVWLQ